MKTTSYRFVFLGNDGKVLRREDHNLADDLTALELAVGRSQDDEIEIWQGRRRVAMVKKHHAPLDEFDARSL